MNLNGKNPRKPTRTILNGYPLVHYDQYKKAALLSHARWHHQSAVKSRHYIGDERFRNPSHKPRRRKPLKTQKASSPLRFILKVFKWIIFLIIAIDFLYFGPLVIFNLIASLF